MLGQKYWVDKKPSGPNGRKICKHTLLPVIARAASWYFHRFVDKNQQEQQNIFKIF